MVQQQNRIGIGEKVDSIAATAHPVDHGALESEQARVKCFACDMIQLEAEWCRRCKKKLPKPVIREVLKEIQTTVVMDVSTFGPKAPVLPMREYERRAIIHAMKRSRTGVEAARALGIGKTTLYRKLIEDKIDKPSHFGRTRLKRKPRPEGCIKTQHCGAGHK